MSGNLLIELGPSAVETLHRLMKRFGEDAPAKMVARAIGLADVASDYLNDDGTVTIVDPHVAGLEVSEDALVDLVFENGAQKPNAPATAGHALQSRI